MNLVLQPKLPTKAIFPSSGFGYFTVGNSGSGSSYNSDPTASSSSYHHHHHHHHHISSSSPPLSSSPSDIIHRCTRPVVSAYAAWHQMVPICMERWCTEANEATQTHCYNPVAPAYPVWAYYAHGRQHRCQEDPVSLPSGRLEKTTRSSPHHVAQHCPTGSETPSPYAPWSSRFGSEPPSVEDNVDVWCYAILELHARNDDERQLYIHTSVQPYHTSTFLNQQYLKTTMITIQ